jgi:hypothetical protein
MGFFSDIIKQNAGNAQQKNVRNLIDNSYKEGMPEEEILDILMKRSFEQLGRQPNEREKDILRMLVIDEKVKMRDGGFIK